MSPEAAETRTFGRTPLQALRAAVILTLLGVAAIALVVRYLMRLESPLGVAFAATGIPPAAVFALGSTIVVAMAVWGYFRSVRMAAVFRLSTSGLEVAIPDFGRYRLEWGNITAVEATETGGLGIRVQDRAAVLQTHQGTPQQREWLRTMQPFGEWDFLYFRSDLGHLPEDVLAWMRSFPQCPRDEPLPSEQ